MEKNKKMIAGILEYYKNRLAVRESLHVNKGLITISLKEYLQKVSEYESVQGLEREELIRLNQRKQKYMIENVDQVLLTEEQQARIIELLAMALDSYEFSDLYYCEDISFAVRLLISAKEKTDDLEEKKEINDYLTLFNNYFKFDESMRCDFSFVRDQFIIKPEDWNASPIFKSENETIKIDNIGKDLFFLDDLFCGYIGNQYCLIQKIHQGEKIYYKPLFLDEDFNKEYEAKTIKGLISLRSVLHRDKLEYLEQEIYSLDSLQNTLLAHNVSITNPECEIEKYKNMAKIAANWWTERIKNPIYDNCDNSLTGMMSRAFMLSINNSEPEVSTEQINKFEKELYNHILMEMLLSLSISGDIDINLDVDYNPCRLLNKCAINAKMTRDFPWKTSMWISGDKITARCGCNGECETLYSDDPAKRKKL